MKRWIIKYNYIILLLCMCMCLILRPGIAKGDTYAEGQPAVFQKGKAAYIIASPKTALEKRITQQLSAYMGKVLKAPIRVVASINLIPGDTPGIILSSHPSASLHVTITKTSVEAFVLKSVLISWHPIIIAAGNTELGLKRAVQRLVIKSQQQLNGLVFPALNLSEAPWIPQREWTICPWSPDRVRRSFNNPAVDKRNDIWLYSDQQIADYVEMFDWFGFSGSQLMETCANYAAVGSPEAFQDRLLKFAKAVRKNGQHVTYWVWAAQFDDYGWFDPQVTYKPAKGYTAFNDPKVFAVFEKYYNGYAKMAPYVDMLIAHYYDPGSLPNREDVFSYLKLLQEKFKQKNPDIKIGVDFWAAGSPSQYMQQLIDHGFGNSLLLEMSMPTVYKAGQREELHKAANKMNLQMGMWGWYMTEYETDQRPMMHVNAQALKGFYQEIKNGVNKIQPITYWSEMEAYHLNNIFSMYASGQLLWNPERDTDEILQEIAEGIWGPRNGPQVLEAIKLIEDVRSGPTWNTFWWGTKEYRLGTADANDDLQRADSAIANFEHMKTDVNYVPKFPLPFPPATFIELTLPHLRQIRQFAEFRIKFNKLQEAAKNGLSKTELSKMAGEAWQPILDYNTWIGSFGQTEATVQAEMLDKLSKEYAFELRTPAWMRYRDAGRYLQRIQNVQRETPGVYQFKGDEGQIRSDLRWSAIKAKDCMQILIKEGAVVPAENGTYQLPDWQEYSKNRIYKY